MKYSLNKLLAGMLVSGALAASAQAAEFVRYEQNGMVSWGELQGTTIHQLTDAPYLGGTHMAKQSLSRLFS